MEDHNYSKSSTYTIADIIQFVIYWRKTFLICFLIFTVLGLILAFLVDRQFKSVARVIPPKEGNAMSSLSSVSSLVKSLPIGLGSLGKRGAEDLDYFAIMKSRTVLEEIIRRFDLKKVYEVSDSSMEKTIKAFQGNSEIDWTEENMLEIRIWDIDAQRAADIANYYVEILNRRSYELYTTEARFNRQFIEQRYEKNKIDLWNAEQALKFYQEKTKTIIPMSVDAVASSGFGELIGLKSKKEVEVLILKRTIGEQHPQYLQALTELEVISKELDKLPEMGITSLRLMRDVVIQQKIMEIIVPLYEQAKVNENKDIPAAYILDSAIPGERPDRPKRAYIVGICSFIGIMIAFSLIYYKIHFRSQNI